MQATSQKPRWLDPLHHACRVRHYSLRTAQRSGIQRRHHAHEGSVGREISAAVKRSGISKRAASHSFRHSFATRIMGACNHIRTVQELLGHEDVNTTMIYAHVLSNKGGRAPEEPARSVTCAVRYGAIQRCCRAGRWT